MATVIVQTLYFMGSYAAIVAILLYVLNWLTKGFIINYLKVKASQGKKVFLQVVSQTDVYYSYGSFSDSTFKYTTRNGKGKVLTDIDGTDTYSTMGVFGLTVDENKDCVIRKNGEVKTAISASSVDDYLDRIIKAKELTNNMDKIIVGILVVVVIGLVILAIMVSGISADLTTIKTVSGII